MKRSWAKSTPLLEYSDQMEELGQYSKSFNMKIKFQCTFLYFARLFTAHESVSDVTGVVETSSGLACLAENGFDAVVHRKIPLSCSG